MEREGGTVGDPCITLHGLTFGIPVECVSNAVLKLQCLPLGVRKQGERGWPRGWTLFFEIRGNS